MTTLNSQSWNKFRWGWDYREVDLWLPRFETKFRIKLKEILCDMGMPSAFNMLTADFNALPDDAICLDNIQQDAVIKVDDDGSLMTTSQADISGDRRAIRQKMCIFMPMN